MIGPYGEDDGGYEPPTDEDWFWLVLGNFERDADEGGLNVKLALRWIGNQTDGWFREKAASMLRYAVMEPTEACWKHRGEQEVVAWGSFTGHAGGRCYFTDLACGCVNMDESDDVAAAR